jgi:hypothetical protein
MKQIYAYPSQPIEKCCMNCIHHNYEENEEEVEILICCRRRKVIEKPNVAEFWDGYGTGVDD